MISNTLFSDTLSFSGGKSTLSLRDGKEKVVLSDGAEILFDSLEIKGDEITLSGKEWRYVESEGLTTIKDSEEGLEIKANGLWFDREESSLVISSWFEIEDTKQELSAMGGTLFYDMDNDTLELMKQVTLSKITENGIMRCTSEYILFDRASNTLTLKEGAKITWGTDTYNAQSITVDLNTDSIKLEGRIEGNING